LVLFHRLSIEQNKFVAAQPVQMPCKGIFAFEITGQALEHSVPGTVPIAVVYSLEIIQVKYSQSARYFRLDDLLLNRIEILFQLPAVGNAGKLVDISKAVQLFTGSVFFIYIL
jgi:hypothetical protein